MVTTPRLVPVFIFILFFFTDTGVCHSNLVHVKKKEATFEGIKCSPCYTELDFYTV